ncbi:hypothetical protein Pmani_023477 [Petrolisthes manimaculis]|uniref:Uncharacterized protein n=1 Tax=Petrolisthes manimaculis TaxID=1843537 RepID=A0AAE1P9V0_9EUCA|nr:hypothetical protein Pmani_023477 [Petrolisthes manimaculis]
MPSLRKEVKRAGWLLTYWRLRMNTTQEALLVVALVILVVKIGLVLLAWPHYGSITTTSFTQHISKFRWRPVRNSKVVATFYCELFLASITTQLFTDTTAISPCFRHHLYTATKICSAYEQTITKPGSEDHNSHHNAMFTLPTKGYTFPNCACIRFGFDIQGLEEARAKASMRPWRYPQWFVSKFNFTGESTCSDYSTQRGGGQKVVAYSYYSPDILTDTESVHFKKYLAQLHGRARVIGKAYPDWIIRIYHNVTTDDVDGTKFLCNIVCTYQHVDLCDVTNLPTLGNLVERGVVGRLWRFSVMGDHTVATFLSRDSDSWVLSREVMVVKEWLQSGHEFHVIRDHPNHKAVMLAGLWGGHNKRRKTLEKVRDVMFSQPTNYTIKFDQYLLSTKLWPIIKLLHLLLLMPYHQQKHTLQHDSYNCLMRTHKDSKPFPTKRVDGLYCG